MTKPYLPVAFIEYVKNPPRGSALARAIAYGIDPTITFYNMYALTPKERMERAGRTIRMAAAIAQEHARRERS